MITPDSPRVKPHRRIDRVAPESIVTARTSASPLPRSTPVPLCRCAAASVNTAPPARTLRDAAMKPKPLVVILLAIGVVGISFVTFWQFRPRHYPHFPLRDGAEFRVLQVTYTSGPSRYFEHNLDAPHARWWIYGHLPVFTRKWIPPPDWGIGPAWPGSARPRPSAPRPRRPIGSARGCPASARGLRSGGGGGYVARRRGGRRLPAAPRLGRRRPSAPAGPSRPAALGRPRRLRPGSLRGRRPAGWAARLGLGSAWPSAPRLGQLGILGSAGSDSRCSPSGRPPSIPKPIRPNSVPPATSSSLSIPASNAISAGPAPPTDLLATTPTIPPATAKSS